MTRARKEGRIKEDFAFQTIIKEIDKFRSGCGSKIISSYVLLGNKHYTAGLMSYDWISIPLVYTQVVTLAVYTFFLSTLMGRQFLDPAKNIPGHEVDLVVPVFTFLQFFFYMGWLKVAEALINPFGEDDDDYEMNWLIDRNLQVAYLIVDEMHAEHPELVKDQFWDEGVPDELPYTVAAEESRADGWIESTSEVVVSPKQSEFVYHEKFDEDDENRSDDMDQIIMNTKKAKPGNLSNKEASSNKLSAIAGKRNESQGSLMQRIFPSTRSSSRIDLQRIESGVSVISNAIKKTRKKSKNNFDKGSRKSSHPLLKRIPTDAREFQQLSESSSSESLEESSRRRARKGFEALEINEARDLIRKDNEYFQNIDRRDWQGEQEIANKNERHRNTNKIRLDQIQEIQAKMMLDLELDNELNKGDTLMSCSNDEKICNLPSSLNIFQEELHNVAPALPEVESGRASQAFYLEPSSSVTSFNDPHNHNYCVESASPTDSIISENQVTIRENPMLINFDKTPENPSEQPILEEIKRDKET